MVFSVRNTTLRSIFELFCPHYCLLCGKLGGIVCDECKIYNSNGCPNKCLECGAIIKDCCLACELPYERSFAVGGRDEGLGKLVDGLKYRSIRALGFAIAEIMDSSLPCFAEDTVVVPVPTIARHVRERGLDHTLLIARKLAGMRGFACARLVRRVTDTVQVGASRRERLAQAKCAYELTGKVEPLRHYLVIDDVCTTGASLAAVCEVLRKGGARKISVAVLAKSGD